MGIYKRENRGDLSNSVKIVKMSGNCDMTSDELQRDLQARTRQLENLNLDIDRKQERLANLEAAVNERKRTIAEKAAELAAKERKVRDLNVVNNRMIDQNKIKSDHLKQLEQVQAEIEMCAEMEMENQCKLLEDNAKFLNMVAEQFMTQGSDPKNPDDIANIIKGLEERIVELEKSINQQLAGITEDHIQAEIESEVLKLRHFESELEGVTQKLAELNNGPGEKPSNHGDN